MGSDRSPHDAPESSPQQLKGIARDLSPVKKIDPSADFEHRGLGGVLRFRRTRPTIGDELSDFTPDLPEPPRAPVHWRLMVCELRIPTIRTFQKRLPEALVDALRRDFPHPPTTLADSERNAVHLLWSQDRDWAMRVEPSAIALETWFSSPFDDFLDRLHRGVEAIEPYLDADFYTRVSLRFVRALDIDEALPTTRIVAQARGRYGEVDAITWRGRTAAARYIVKEGVESETGTITCVRDTDFYAENVEASSRDEILRRLHEASRTFAIADAEIESRRDTPTPAVPARPTRVLAFPEYLPFDEEPEASRPVGPENHTTEPPDSTAALTDPDAVNAERLEFLARKYAERDFSLEDDARLKILTERIRRLIPHVTEQDFERLEELASGTNAIHQRRIERWQRLGLDSET